MQTGGPRPSLRPFAAGASRAGAAVGVPPPRCSHNLLLTTSLPAMASPRGRRQCWG